MFNCTGFLRGSGLNLWTLLCLERASSSKHILFVKLTSKLSMSWIKQVIEAKAIAKEEIVDHRAIMNS